MTPKLGPLGRLHQPAFAQVELGAGDHEPLDQKCVAQPKDRTDVVVVGHVVEQHRDGLAGQCCEVTPIRLASAQLGRRQNPAARRGSQQDGHCDHPDQYSSASMILITRSVTVVSAGSGECWVRLLS